MAAPPPSPWRAAHAALAQSTLGEALGAGCWTPAARLLTLRARATAGEALALLAAGRVLSAPLLAPDGGVAGVAEARAAAAAFLRAYDIQAGELKAAEAGASDAIDMGALAAEAARRAADDVARRSAAEALLPSSEAPPLLRLSGYVAQTPLLEVVRRALLRQAPPATEAAAHDATAAAAAARETPRHRALLTTSSSGERGDALMGLLSASDVARFLERRLPAEALAAPLAAFALPPSRAPPRRADLDAPALDALRTLLHENVAALLATDDEDAPPADEETPPLAACFSHSDLRALGPHDFGMLALPLGEFLVLQRALAEAPRAAGLSPALAAAAAACAAGAPHVPAVGRAPGWRAALRSAAPLVALPRHATLAQLLAALRQHRVHRVFIRPVAADDIDDPMALPDAVISVTDVLRALADGPTE